jgi:Phage integrase family
VRPVPLEPALIPILEAMRGEPSTYVVAFAHLRIGDRHNAAPTLRADLHRAGVLAPRLYRDDATYMPVDFRCLRDTYATWLALAGHDVQVMMRRLGHNNYATTLRYAKVAEGLGTGIGKPFPDVPNAQAIARGNTGRDATADATKLEFPAEKMWAGRDLNPGPTD